MRKQPARAAALLRIHARAYAPRVHFPSCFAAVGLLAVGSLPLRKANG
ncbi:MAG: hypothetical protein ACKVU2_10865 [Saprospiraceae bacterium]